MNNKKADLFNKYKQVGAQFFVFAAGGVVNFLLNIGLTYLLTEVFDIYYLLSFAIVQIIVIIYGFVYNTFLTFRLKKASTWIFVKFITFLHIFALVNILLVRFFTDVVGLQYLISIIITIFATIILRFFLYKKYVFVEDNSSTKKIILANYPMIILGVALFIVLLFIYGFIPGLYLNDLSAHYLMAANTDCILNHGVFNLSPCFNYGYPHGYPFLIGLPLIYVSAAISRIFSVSSYLSNVIAGIIVLVVSNLSIIALFKKFKIKTWLAVIFAFIWLASTILYKQTGYIYVMYGFILLPFYILINYLFFTTSQTTKKQLITWSLILLLVRVFAMFTDGYSFIISLLASGFLWLAFVIKEYKNTKKVIYYTIIIGIANLIPVFLYKIYTDMLGNFSVMPIDFFRAQGVDLISLFVPSNAYWWADLLNVGPIWGDSQVA
ncbi:GtrA family protein, partial [Patescibacteria group bacterium]|nr:GtrA family protein [Patescibacteria group bacterium]